MHPHNDNIRVDTRKAQSLWQQHRWLQPVLARRVYPNRFSTTVTSLARSWFSTGCGPATTMSTSWGEMHPESRLQTLVRHRHRDCATALQRQNLHRHRHKLGLHQGHALRKGQGGALHERCRGPGDRDRTGGHKLIQACQHTGDPASVTVSGSTPTPPMRYPSDGRPGGRPALTRQA